MEQSGRDAVGTHSVAVGTGIATPGVGQGRTAHIRGLDVVFDITAGRGHGDFTRKKIAGVCGHPFALPGSQVDTPTQHDALCIHILPAGDPRGYGSGCGSLVRISQSFVFDVRAPEIDGSLGIDNSPTVVVVGIFGPAACRTQGLADLPGVKTGIGFQHQGHDPGNLGGCETGTRYVGIYPIGMPGTCNRTEAQGHQVGFDATVESRTAGT